MGLLGENWDDPRTMAALQMGAGLLAAGGPSRSPTNLGMGLLGGLNQYQDVMDAAARKKLLEEELALRRMDTEARAKNYEAEAEARKVAAAERAAAIEQERRKREFLTEMVSPITGPQAVSAAGGPTNNAAALQGQQRPITPELLQRAFAMGVSPEVIRGIADAKNMGKSEISSWKQVRMPDGSVMEIPYDKYGMPVSEGVRPYVKPDMVSLGNRVEAVDPTQVRGGQTFAIGQSPDSAASVAATIRGQNMTDARAREANSIAQVGKPHFADGSWFYPPTPDNPRGTMVTAPGAALPKGSPAANAENAKTVGEIVSMAKELIPKSTGSYVGTGVDILAQGVGRSTEGAKAIAQLKVLEGALMAKMPRMEGPQSNIDVQLYRQSAAQIADPTVPAGVRMAALSTLEALQAKYAGGGGVTQGVGTQSVTGRIGTFNPTTGKIEYQ